VERKVGNVPELISHNLADYFKFIYWSFIQSGEEEQTPEERRTRLKKADSIRRMLADGSTVPVVTSKIFIYLFIFIYLVEMNVFLCTENSKHIFLEMKLRCLFPSIHIHVSVL
jgi:hypothetical protein